MKFELQYLYLELLYLELLIEITENEQRYPDVPMWSVLRQVQLRSSHSLPGGMHLAQGTQSFPVPCWTPLLLHGRGHHRRCLHGGH